MNEWVEKNRGHEGRNFLSTGSANGENREMFHVEHFSILKNIDQKQNKITLNKIFFTFRLIKLM
jgi:hypothetical protein